MARNVLGFGLWRVPQGSSLVPTPCKQLVPSSIHNIQNYNNKIKYPNFSKGRPNTVKSAKYTQIQEKGKKQKSDKDKVKKKKKKIKGEGAHLAIIANGKRVSATSDNRPDSP